MNDAENAAGTAESVLPADLPQSVQLAGQIAGLSEYLEDAALGFHWDLLDQLEDGVYIVDLDRRIRYWSSGAERITGYTAAEVLGRSCTANLLQHVDEQGRRLCGKGCPLSAVIAKGQSCSTDLFLHHKEGHRVPVRVCGAAIRDWQGRVIGAFETFSDTSQLAADADRIRTLEAQAYLDTLTEIPNRRYLESTLASRQAELDREGLPFGLIMADVDHFKKFNDEHGHETGDAVLKMVARTLVHSCRSYDLAARWGGEEFVVVAGNGTSENVQAFANRLRALVEQSTLEHSGKKLAVTVSMGVTVAKPGDNAASLLARADKSLYQSKADGRNRITFGE